MPKLKIVFGNLVTLPCDVIVNAANPQLFHGGGLDHTVRDAAGPEMDMETERMRRSSRSPNSMLAPGEVIRMDSFKIRSCRYVIHAAAPNLNSGLTHRNPTKDDELSLTNTYLNCMKSASAVTCKHIAYPILGAGIYSYPLDQAFLIGLQSVLVFFEVYPASSIEEVSFVIFNDQAMYARCQTLMMHRTSMDISCSSSVRKDIVGAYWPGGSRESTNIVFQDSGNAVSIATFYNQPAGFLNTQNSYVSTSRSGFNSLPIRGEEVHRTGLTMSSRSSFTVPTREPEFMVPADRPKGLKRSMLNETRAESELNLTPTKQRMKVSTSSEEKRAKDAAYKREYRARQKEQTTGLSQTLADSAIDQTSHSDNDSIGSRESSVSRQYKMTDAKREDARLRKQKQRLAAAKQPKEEIPFDQVPHDRGSSASSVATQSDRERNAERQREHRSRMAQMRNETENQPRLAGSNTDATRIIATVHVDLPELHNLGQFNVVCPFCNGLSFPGRRNCCNNGKVWIEPFKELPEPIKGLLDSGNRSFLEVIVQMNSLLAMASNVYTKEPVGPFGVQATKVLGPVNHFPSALRVNPGGKEAFGNYYCYDAQEATKRRMDSSWSDGVDEELLKELTRVLHRTHPLAQSYRMMHEVLKREERKGRDPGRMKMRIVTAHEAQDMDVNLLQHEGTYSVPAGNDFVCVFFTCSPSQVVLPRGLTVYKSRGNHNSHEIKFYTKVVDALCYPLMFPYGEGLWEACRLPMEFNPRRYEDKIEEIRSRSETGIELLDIATSLEPTRYDYEDDIAGVSGNEMEDTIAELAAGQLEQAGTQRGIIMVERGGEVYPERVVESEEIPLNDGYMTDDSGPDQDFEDDLIDQLVQQQETVPDEEHMNIDVTDYEPEFDDAMIEQLVQLRNQTEQDDEYGGILGNLEEILDQQDEDRLQAFGDDFIRPVDFDDHEYEEEYTDDSAPDEAVPVSNPTEMDEREEPTEYIEGEEQPQDCDDFTETRQPSRRRGFISIREAALFFNRYPKEQKSRIAQFRKLGQFQSYDSIASHLDVSGYQAKYLADVDVIVWDEASMSDRRIYEAVDNFLRIIKGNQQFMGGILTVFGGDWRQTLPILDDMPESAIPTYTLKNTDLWNSTVKLRLNINQRAHLDPQFCDFLVRVGNGTANDERSQVELPQQIMKSSEASVIDWLYPLDEMDKYDEMCQKTLLTVDNRTALELNDKILVRMGGQPKTYLSMDKTDSQKGFVSIDPEIYKTMTPSGMPPHKLILKKNCQVILLRNQNVKLGLCNGTRMRVLQLGEDTILCAPVNPGPFTPEKVVIHRMDLTPARAPTKDFAFIRHQFPLRLAFAMTVNKSQGQTLNKVGLILRTPCFSHGQLYVALSRVRSKDDIRVYNSKKDARGCSNMVTNRVLKAVLN